jgi:site-specific DNA-methyltransferase (adenine-specific)
MILCDLPYGTTNCHWDTIIPFEPLWEHYKRIIKPNGAIVLTASQPFTTDLINSNRKWFKYDMIWEKTRGVGMLNANKMPLRLHEEILIFYNMLPTYNPQKSKTGYIEKRKRTAGRPIKGIYNSHNTSSKYEDIGERHPLSIVKYKNNPWNGMLFGRPFACETNTHPTQKPVALFEYLIRTYTNEGETVLDNCMGSGTTAIACIRSGRQFIGFETDKQYYEASLKRIENELSKQRLNFGE